MPTYQYVCKMCGHHLEEFHSITEPHLVHCPNCNTDNLARIIGGGGGLIFKGSGFYLTDYKKDAKSSGGEAEKEKDAKSSEGEAEKKKDAKSSEGEAEKKKNAKSSVGEAEKKKESGSQDGKKEGSNGP